MKHDEQAGTKVRGGQVMTHDELLSKLLISDETKLYETLTMWQKALYAVVKWHSPSKSSMTSEVGCTGCGYNSEYSTWEFEWPCPTIYAIELELS
jgi:hypothetical protein